MGYQESLLFCENKRELKKLCRVLNSARPEFEDHMDVYSIGKLKEKLGIDNIFTGECEFYFPKGTYFVLWGGERYPYQGDNALEEHMSNTFGADYASWECVFIEYVDGMYKFTENINQKETGVLQENEYISVIEIAERHVIEKEYIMKL